MPLRTVTEVRFNASQDRQEEQESLSGPSGRAGEPLRTVPGMRLKPLRTVPGMRLKPLRTVRRSSRAGLYTVVGGGPGCIPWVGGSTPHSGI